MKIYHHSVIFSYSFMEEAYSEIEDWWFSIFLALVIKSHEKPTKDVMWLSTPSPFVPTEDL